LHANKDEEIEVVSATLMLENGFVWPEV